MSTADNAREAAVVLRRLLDAVDVGELEAHGPLAGRVVRQLHGAVVALDVLGRQPALAPAQPSPRLGVVADDDGLSLQ